MEDFFTNLRKIKRGPAIMLEKDIGIILANTDIKKSSIVLDAGSGCGVTTIFLAKFVKKVYSYDIRSDFLEIAKENARRFNLKNIVFKNKDVSQEIKERNLDLISLDLREPWQVLDQAYLALKENGYLTAYLPNITQVQELVLKLNNKFKVVKVLETIERKWIVEEKRVRPENMIIGHTGFIIIIKKV